MPPHSLDICLMVCHSTRRPGLLDLGGLSFAAGLKIRFLACSSVAGAPRFMAATEMKPAMAARPKMLGRTTRSDERRYVSRLSRLFLRRARDGRFRRLDGVEEGALWEDFVGGFKELTYHGFGCSDLVGRDAWL